MSRLFSFRHPVSVSLLCVFVVRFSATAQSRAHELSGLEQQQASIQLQRESVEKQLARVHPLPSSKRVNAKQPYGAALVSPSVGLPVEMPAFPPESESFFAPQPAYDCPPMAPTESETLITSAAKQEEISPALLRAVIRRESAFHPCAVSNRGALGLMQLMPATAEQFGVDDPLDAKQNISGGAAFLKQLLNRFGGDVRLALGAYNAGPERVDAAGGIPEIAETQNYVEAISDEIGIPSPPPVLESHKAITNVMVKPDLRHLTLAAPSLNFSAPATPAHLTSAR